MPPARPEPDQLTTQHGLLHSLLARFRQSRGSGRPSARDQFRDGFEAGYRRGYSAGVIDGLLTGESHDGQVRAAYLDELEQREAQRQSEPDRGEPS